MDKPNANLMPVLYAHRIHELQTICRANGYALAIHGSMQRDLDAIAIPWTDKAVDPKDLINRLCEAMDLEIGPRSPTRKPHGRKTWTLLLKTIGFIDLSVMPLLHVQSTSQQEG